MYVCDAGGTVLKCNMYYKLILRVLIKYYDWKQLTFTVLDINPHDLQRHYVFTSLQNTQIFGWKISIKYWLPASPWPSGEMFIQLHMGNTRTDNKVKQVYCTISLCHQRHCNEQSTTVFKHYLFFLICTLYRLFNWFFLHLS